MSTYTWQHGYLNLVTKLNNKNSIYDNNANYKIQYTKKQAWQYKVLVLDCMNSQHINNNLYTLTVLIYTYTV